jgi:solute carrier family 25 phosphate transporter 23/24/25/41
MKLQGLLSWPLDFEVLQKQLMPLCNFSLYLFSWYIFIFRTRMVVGVGSRHIGGSFVEIMEQNGWPGLWVGNTINMIRIIPTQAIELGTFEYVKRGMKSAQGKWKEDGCPKIQLGNMKIELPLHLLSPVAIAGAAAGIAGTLMCHPLEVIKVSAKLIPPC